MTTPRPAPPQGGSPSRGARTLRVVALVALLVAVVTGALLLSRALGRDEVDGEAATPEPVTGSWTYPSNPPPSGPVVEPSVSPTPIPPTATTLEEFVPEAVDSFDWSASGEDAEAIAAGARAAEEGTFTTEDDEVTAGMAEWDTPDQAADNARTRAAADFPGQEPLAEGEIRNGAGHFWYYERDGVGTVYWYHGRFSAEFSGAPYTVQEFFLRFPK